MTQAEYRALGNGTAPANPTGNPRARCILGWSEPVYDTASGKLEPGDVAAWSEGATWFNRDSAAPNPPRVVLGLPAMKPMGVPTRDITGSVDNTATLSINTRRAGITVTNGVLSVT